MTWMPLATVGAAVSVALAAWGCLVIGRVLASVRTISGFDGMHFEDPSPASPSG